MTNTIEIGTSTFERSHGRKPKGHGAWGFLVIDESSGCEVATFFAPAMRLADAMKWAREHVRSEWADELATGFLSLEVAP